MNAYGIGLALASALLIGALAPVPAAAQQGSGWIGIAYEPPADGDWSRVEIQEVHRGSPAERAGLRRGDVIVRVNGRTAGSVEEFRPRPAPGDRIRFRVEREGRSRDIRVTAGERPSRLVRATPARMRGDTTVVIDATRIRETVWAALDSVRMHLDTLRLPTVTIERDGDGARLRVDGPDGERRVVVRVEDDGRGASVVLPRRPERGERPGEVVSVRTLQRGVAGAEVRAINPGLAKYFGVDAGVVVLDVPEETPAARSGLHVGDVIVRAGGREVASVETLRQAISSAEDRQVPLTVVREQRRQAITLRWE